MVMMMIIIIIKSSVLVSDTRLVVLVAACEFRRHDNGDAIHGLDLESVDVRVGEMGQIISLCRYFLNYLRADSPQLGQV